MNTTTYEFTNERDAVRFARSRGGLISITVEKLGRGRWVVTITPNTK